MEEIKSAYVSAKRRLFLLDYDGTLVGYAPTPDKARPAVRLKRLLHLLASDPANTVVIISGRPPETIDEWLDGLGLDAAAEHGHFVKQTGGNWHRTTPSSTSWKRAVRQYMSAAVRAVPGSFIEEKHTSLVWHYRQAAASAEKHADELLQTLQNIPGMLANKGTKIIEARQPGADKGQVAGQWLKNNQYDFVLAAGDDTTDEDLFAALPTTAFSIKIGPSASKAKLRLDSSQQFVTMLEDLTKKVNNS